MDAIARLQITRMISAQIALHSFQLPLLIINRLTIGLKVGRVMEKHKLGIKAYEPKEKLQTVLTIFFIP